MKIPLRALWFVTVLAAGAAPAGAQTALPPAGVTVIHLTAQAEQMMTRDRLRAGLAVEATGTGPQQVQAEINRRMEAALARVKQTASVKAQSGGYSVYQDREPNKPPLWRGSQSLSLWSDTPADLLKLVGDLQQMGLATQGLAYELAPETMRKAEDALTAQALDMIRQRADRIAAALGLKVQQLRNVTLGNAAANAPGPVPMRVMAAAAGGAAPPPSAEAGDATVSVSVQAEVWLAP